MAFGATVSGRPAELPGALTMLGLFINTLPVIGTPRPAERVGDWLRALQADNLALRDHEHAPLPDIQRWAGRAGQALFDSIIVFENHPVDRTLRDWDDRTLRFEGAADAGVTNFPMDLMVTLEEDGLEIEYMSLRASFEMAAVERLRGRMEWLLEQLTRMPAAARAPGPGDPGRAPALAARNGLDPGFRASRRSIATMPGGGTSGGGGADLRRCRAELRRAGRPRRPARRLAAPAGVGPESRSASPWAARPIWSSPCSPSSGPAAPMSRSIPSTRPSACA